MYAIFTYIWVFVGANVGKYSIHGAYGTVEFSNRNHICEDCQIAYCGAQGSNRFNRFTARAGATRSACSNTCGAGTAERQATRRMWDGCPEMERNTVKTSILGCSLSCTQDVFFLASPGKSMEKSNFARCFWYSTKFVQEDSSEICFAIWHTGVLGSSWMKGTRAVTFWTSKVIYMYTMCIEGAYSYIKKTW